MTIAAIVLAAGASTRMGRTKMVLPLGRGTVLSAAVAPLLEAGLDRVVVVLGHEAEEVLRRAGLPQDPRLCVVIHEGWREGMSSSLRRGLVECEDAAAVLVALGDQPGVSPLVVERLVDSHRAGARLAVPVHGDRAGHPVLFARDLWDELRTATGEKGGRDVVERHWREAAVVDAPPLRDIDTEEDYRAALEGRGAPSGEGLETPRKGTSTSGR